MGFQFRLLLVGLAMTYYINPLYIRSSSFSLVRSVYGYVDLTPEEDPESLQAAVSNVTTDITQLTAILEDFFQRQPDDSAEVSFRELLQKKAVRRHRNLEYYLDWILGFYKFAWPFVLVYALMRLSANKPVINDDAQPQRKAQKIRKKVEGDARKDRQKQANGTISHQTLSSDGFNSLVREEAKPHEGQIRLTRRIGSAQNLS